MDNTGDPLVGRVLDGRYRVGPRIARGGMASVYEGTDLRLDRQVAIKIMHAGLADDPDFVRRFEREARSAAKLSHPNVVAVFDQGADGDTLFLVMEHIRGQTLRDVIRAEAPMSPSRALTLLEPVLAALSAAHRNGMIHRDIKPENVLITSAGAGEPGHHDDVKVADFGLARAVNAETHATTTGGLLIGTVSYLAPELVADGHADARADVYAAGVLLYEMLTGRKPHQADTPIQVAYKHVHEDIPAPSAVVPGLPDYVDALVARATARDTSVRPADAGVLLHQVRRVKQALEQGVRADAELTEDLTPSVREHTDELPDLQGALPERIIDPSTPGALDDYETATAGPYLPATQEDHTVAVPVGPGPGADVPEPPLERPGRRGPLLLAALVALVLLIGLGGWYFGIARYTVTPSVIDLSSAAAKTKLEKSGLSMHVDHTEYSENFVKGAVISSDPGAGDRIHKHGTVDVVLSKGPERHKVPKLRGMTLDQARSALEDADLVLGDTSQRYSGKIPQDQVISSDPHAGSEQRRDTAIDVVLSKGPKPIDIPNLTGEKAAAAKKRLKKLGFKVDEGARDFSTSIPKGSVLSQSPDSGTGHKGDTITLVISKGPQMVTLPDVRGSSYDGAKRRLEAMGLNVRRKNSSIYFHLDRVANTDPAPNTRVPVGSTITLILV
ncbi:MAG TPA: Stk1 family PASTA domain-containing Ser/Thr kinase [Marmoricola sp.]